MKKMIVHSFRYLLFAKQLKTIRCIDNYSIANDLYYQVMDFPLPINDSNNSNNNNTSNCNIVHNSPNNNNNTIESNGNSTNSNTSSSNNILWKEMENKWRPVYLDLLEDVFPKGQIETDYFIADLKDEEDEPEAIAELRRALHFHGTFEGQAKVTLSTSRLHFLLLSFYL